MHLDLSLDRVFFQLKVEMEATAAATLLAVLEEEGESLCISTVQ